MTRRLAGIALLLLNACVVPRPPAKLPPQNEGYVAVLSGEMSGAISQVARHSWIIANVPGEGRLRRFELQHSGSDPFDYFGNGDVAVHAVIHYEQHELIRVVECLEGAESQYFNDHASYFPIPGPNSNTIVDFMLRRCHIHAELPATAIGRDYRGVVGVSTTSLGTGLQLESWVLGMKLGLQEGAEVHVLDMALGVHLWPPGITVPANPGRIGFDDSSWHKADQYRFRGSRRIDREYGLTSLWLWSKYARVAEPTQARGLSDVGTVGFDGRAGYGSHIGYGFGVDLEAGVGAPLGFAYATRLYPLGAMWMLKNNTFIGGFVGIGADGVGGHIPSAFEFPAELRFELDAAKRARWGAYGRVAWFPAVSARRGGSLLSPYADELTLGTFLRLGLAPGCNCSGHMGRGYFFALERREALRSHWLGLVFGIEADMGG
jgi:hypothetical protein